MAKRKRLDPTPLPPSAPGPGPGSGPDASAAAPEVKSLGGRDAFTPGAPLPGRMAPIASVAADGAARAALAEVSAELARARAEGRMVLSLPLDAVDDSYLVRDRMAPAADEMEALTASLRARGQQAPIEVADLGDGRYGLISGWRRLMALRALARDEGHAPQVLALLRVPEAAAGAYLAMVEENEIRAALSFYERARIVVRAADAGVFESDRAALSHLFSAVPRARRSKIGSFVRLVRALEPDGGPILRYPSALSEKLGLALVAALSEDPDLVDRLARDFARMPPVSDVEESLRIGMHLKRPKDTQGTEPAGPDRAAAEIGVTQLAEDRVILEGPGVADPGFRKALDRWIARGCR